jgi:hypothetical protein
VIPSIIPARLSNLSIDISVSGDTLLSDLAVFGEESPVLCSFKVASVGQRAVTAAQAIEPRKVTCVTPVGLGMSDDARLISVSLYVGDIAVSSEFFLSMVAPISATTLIPNISTAQGLDFLQISLLAWPPRWLFRRGLRCRLGNGTVTGQATWMGAERILCGVLNADPMKLLPGMVPVFIEAVDESWSVRVGDMLIVSPLLHRRVNAPDDDIYTPTAPKQQPFTVLPLYSNDSLQLIGSAAPVDTHFRIEGNFPVPCPDCRCVLDYASLGPPLEVMRKSALCELPAQAMTTSPSFHRLGVVLHSTAHFAQLGSSLPIVSMPAVPLWSPKPVAVRTGDCRGPQAAEHCDAGAETRDSINHPSPTEQFKH